MEALAARPAASGTSHYHRRARCYASDQVAGYSSTARHHVFAARPARAVAPCTTICCTRAPSRLLRSTACGIATACGRAQSPCRDHTPAGRNKARYVAIGICVCRTCWRMRDAAARSRLTPGVRVCAPLYSSESVDLADPAVQAHGAAAGVTLVPGGTPRVASQSAASPHGLSTQPAGGTSTSAHGSPRYQGGNTLEAVEDGANADAGRGPRSQASVSFDDDDTTPLEVLVPPRGSVPRAPPPRYIRGRASPKPLGTPCRPPEKRVASSHSRLRHVSSMGPLALALHTASMIGPAQIDRDECVLHVAMRGQQQLTRLVCTYTCRACSRKEAEDAHPLVHLVEKAFPEGGRVWQAAERIITTLDPDARVRQVAGLVGACA